MNLRPVLLSLLISLLLLSAAAGASYIQPTTSVTTSPPVRVRTIMMVTTTVPPAGGLTISSTPPGATVIIDGVYKGTTPLTVRPLAAGTHSLILTLDGYEDATATITIASSLERKSYTLVPVTRATTPTPATTSVPVKVATLPIIPPRKIPVVQNLSAEFRFPRPVSIQPLVITVGSHTKTPRLSTLSPYFGDQLAVPPGTAGWVTPDIKTKLTSYAEVDSYNVYLPQSHLMSSAEMALDPVWGDEDTVYIATTDRFYNNTNFRWISAEPGVTGFYQVSRYPFDSNASHWQNQYVPGLVSSGPVKDVHVDSGGFHYFSLNFASIANHNPSDPPFYTGVAQLDPTVPGKGKPMDMVRVPLIGIGIWTKKGTFGPVTLPLPAGLTFLSAGDFTESELGNPNQNMILSSSGTSPSRAATAIESAIADLPRTYYVRVVPLHNGGTAGVPTLPVRVTVVRPKPCPPNPPSNTENDLLVRPPSATIASFYMTSFVPDWIHTDQNGKLVSRAHFVTVTTPPACSAPKATPAGGMSGQVIDSLNAQTCTMYGGSQPGYHFYADPEETHWYDTVWDIITGLFGAFAEVIHAVSSAWNEIQALAVKAAAYAVQGLTLGQFDCNSSPACTDLLSTGLSIAMTSLGVPPTIPDVADLENMGADYMARVAAEELGAGGLLDTAKEVYNNLPGDVQQTIKDKSGDVGTDIAGSLTAQTGAATAAAAGGNFYIPDPLYYQAHPATVMVKVSNPNNFPTDHVSMVVHDSSGLFRQSQAVYIPSLGPYESTVVPVVLEENFTKVYTPDCNANAYTSICGDICVPCYWNLWYFAVIDSSKSGGDTFSATFSTMKDGHYMVLTPSSSGTVLTSQNIITFDDQGKSCGAYNTKTVLQYPAGWQMETNSLNQDLWNLCWLKYSFTEGDHGRLIGG